MSSQEEPVAGLHPLTWWRPLLLVVVLVAGVFVMVRFGGLDPTDVADRFQSFGVWGPLVFVLAFGLAGVFFFPATILTLVGGLLFGVVWGILLVWVGTNLGALLGYALGRFGGGPFKPFLDRRVGGMMRFFESHGLVSVIALRMVPVLPFSALNFGLAFAFVRPRDYFLGTAVGVLPLVVAYVLAGAAAGEIARGGALGAPVVAMFVVSVVMLAGITWFAARLTRRHPGGRKVPGEGGDLQKPQQK